MVRSLRSEKKGAHLHPTPVARVSKAGAFFTTCVCPLFFVLDKLGSKNHSPWGGCVILRVTCGKFCTFRNIISSIISAVSPTSGVSLYSARSINAFEPVRTWDEIICSDSFISYRKCRDHQNTEHQHHQKSSSRASTCMR